MKNIYILGAGAIGASYAAVLHKYDPQCVTLVADKERCERYKKGFVINNKKYIFKTITPEEIEKPVDFVIIAVKNQHLNGAIDSIEKAVGENTIIMSLLNGISSEEILGERFGIEKLVYSMCVGIDAVRIGNETTYSQLGKIFFGDKNNEVLSDKVKLIKDLFDKAEVPYEIPIDMYRKLWWKFMVNTGANQISALLRAPYGVLKTDKDARDLMRKTMEEVIDLSIPEGINLNNEDYLHWLKVLDGLSDEGKTSMLQDVEAGRKTEVELFAGTVVELGKKYNVSTPLNEIWLAMIKVIEKN
ncbi:ketopantoate reductase family protein [Clostridium grantii]|uniref:2-dehydropantoate 2-reductase n=1 Tax=Clostridium grantii DSM 8605 TaxID=1121316 RepID=A0A1M5SNZ5_9CLOT|nr:ketopantoate reductase family protein [Clostridium grantii]SHH40038.1 ketopantoate reductase [Clostridium grantii DSM 8605]